MIRSMTGFGRGVVTSEQYAVRVEVRSVNNRSLRMSFRIPERLQSLEAELDKIARAAVARGTVNVIVALEELAGEPEYFIDPAAVRHYRDTLEGLAKELGVSADLSIDTFVALPGAVKKTKALEELPEELSRAAHQALKEALATLVKAREEEGDFIWQDMTARTRNIAALADQVEARIPGMIDEYRQRLSDRLAKLLEGVGASLKEEELHREIALYSDRSDISEELSRLRSHVTLMEQLGASKEPCGRKLEFITQEMFREANTMASKALSAELTSAILDLKGEIEKIKEQALNVE